MAWAYVQGGIHQNGSTSSATNSVTLASAIGAGNLVCVTIGYAGTSSDTLTVTDNKSNIYTAVDKITNIGGGYAWYTFYCAGVTNGPTTITATDQAGAVSFSTIIVDEFSGGGSGAILDGHAIASYDASSTTTDALSSGAFTTTVAGDLIYGTTVNINSSGAPSTGTGFSAGQSDVATFSTDYKTQVASGSVAATFTLTTSSRVIVAGMAFKATVGGTIHNQSVAITCVTSPSLKRQVGKLLSVASTTTMVSTRSTGKVVAITSITTTVLKRAVSKTIAMASTTSVSSLKSVQKALSISSTTAVSYIKSVKKSISTSLSSAVSLASGLAKFIVISVGISSSVTQAKSVGKGILASTTTSVSSLRRVLKGISVSGSTTATAFKTVSKSVIVGSTTTTSITKSIAKSLFVFSTSVVAMTNGLAKLVVISVGVNSVAAISRLVDKGISVSSSTATSINRAISKRLIVASSLSVSVNKIFPKSISVVVTSSVAVAKRIGKVVSVYVGTISSTVTVVRSIMVFIYTGLRMVATAIVGPREVSASERTREIATVPDRPRLLQAVNNPMITLNWPPKDPEEILDYSINWVGRLDRDDSIAVSTWSVPTSLVVLNSSSSNTVSIVWLSGGVVSPNPVKITNRVVTAGGRTMEQSVTLKIVDK